MSLVYFSVSLLSMMTYSFLVNVSGYLPLLLPLAASHVTVIRSDSGIEPFTGFIELLGRFDVIYYTHI